jgi:antitoxin HicB
MAYRIKLEPDDNGTLLVTSPTLPGMVTFGLDRADAIRRAAAAIEEWLAAAIDRGEDIPEGADTPVGGISARPGEDVVMLPVLTELKVELYRMLRRKAVTRAELARRLQWNRESVDRLFRLNHASRLPQIEAAARALEAKVEAHIIGASKSRRTEAAR